MNKTFSGKFMLRMNPELDHAMHVQVIKAGKSQAYVLTAPDNSSIRF